MKTLKAFFLYSSALVLIVTGLAKFFSASGDVKLLHTPDPLLHFNYGILVPAVAAYELAVAAVLLLSRCEKLKFLSLLWLSLNFMLYRLGYWFVGLPLEHCKCLGNLTDTLGLNPKLVQAALQVLVLYLFAGSALGFLGSVMKERAGGRVTILPMPLERRTEGTTQSSL